MRALIVAALISAGCGEINKRYITQLEGAKGEKGEQGEKGDDAPLTVIIPVNILLDRDKPDYQSNYHVIGEDLKKLRLPVAKDFTVTLGASDDQGGTGSPWIEINTDVAKACYQILIPNTKVTHAHVSPKFTPCSSKVEHDYISIGDVVFTTEADIYFGPKYKVNNKIYDVNLQVNILAELEEF